jgi:hypothetical protein
MREIGATSLQISFYKTQGIEAGRGWVDGEKGAIILYCVCVTNTL